MGVHLVDLFRETKDDVYVTSRKQRQSEGNIHYIQGNAHDIAFVDSLLSQNFDVVVDFMTYNTEGFKTVYQKFLNSCSQYIYLSSSRAYDDCDGYIKEDSPLLAHSCTDKEYLDTDEYAISKGREEDLLRGSGNSNYTIIRPYITYSSYRLQLGVMEKEDWLYRAMKGRPIVFSKDIASKYTTLTYGMDVAKGIFALIGNKDALGEAFHITFSEPVKWQDVMNIYVEELSKLLHQKPIVIMQDRAFNLQLSYRKWQVIYDRLFNRRFDNSKISHFVDTGKFTRTDEGLRACIRSFVEKPRFKNPDWRIQAEYDRISGCLAKPKEFKDIRLYIRYMAYRFRLKR